MLILSAAVIVTLVFIDPMGPLGHFLPKCPVKTLTGWDCPGCGSTRALHSLIEGEPLQALRCNFFLPIALVLAVGAMLTEAFPKRLQHLRHIVMSPIVLYGFIALAIAWWIVRNILNI